MSKNLILVLAIVTSLTAGAAETVWTYDTTGGYVDCSPGVGDLNGDARPDLVLPTTTGSLIALDGDRTELWRYESNERLAIAPTVANVTGGPEMEVIVVALTGKVFCFEGPTGTVLWQYTLPAAVEWGRTTVAVADIDANGSPELIVPDSGQTLTCLNGEGQLIWAYKHPAVLNSCPAVGDLDSDGKLEVLVGAADSPVVCVSHEGNKLWQAPPEGAQGASPSLFDLNGDNKPEILVGIGNNIAALDSAGAVLWTYPLTKEVDGAVTVVDADADGAVEIYVADLAGRFVSLTPDGGLRWEANVEQRVRRNPAVADVDGDGVNEVLIASYSSKLYLFNPNGLLEETVVLKGQSNATPTVADFNGDGNLEVALPDAGYKVHMFGWLQGDHKGSILAGEFRTNSNRTGAVQKVQEKIDVAVQQFDPGDCYVGPNVFSVAVTNPDKKKLEVSLTMLRNGVPSSAAKTEANEQRILRDLVYTLDGAAPVPVTFLCEVFENGNLITRRTYNAYIVPFAKELADLSRLADQIDQHMPKLPEAKTLENVLYRARALMPQLRDESLVAGTSGAAERTRLARQFADLRQDLAAAAAMARAAAAGDGCSLAVYAANPWAPFGNTDELIERAKAGTLADVAKETSVSLAAFSGEKESAAINVFNFSDRTRVLRVDIDDLKKDDAAKPAVEVREVLDTPTQMHRYSADALPALNQGRTVIVPPWNGRQLFITVDAAALDPGAWEGQIKLRALDVENVDALAKLSVQVWNAKLPEKQPLHLCHWGYVHRSILQDQPQAALDDQVAHGTNVFVGLHYPQATCDDAGNIVGDIDFSAHDEYVRNHAPHGRILFFSYQSALKGAPMLSDPWKKAHVQYLRAWVKRLAELGVGYDKFALYPIDEPGLAPGLADKHVELGKLAREADPNIRMYTDPVAACTMDELTAMAPYVDIWCPNRGGFLLNRNADKLAFIKSTGAEVWTYECDDNAKHQSPLGYYRSQAWLAWHHGLTGIGFWSYCTSKDDPWYFADKDYLLIYQGDGVVPSKRWQAIRDGVEDYAILAALRDAADAAQKEGRAPEAVAEARNLLSTTASAIADFCGRDRYGTVPGPLGPTGDRTVENIRWENLQQTRANIAQILEKL